MKIKVKDKMEKHKLFKDIETGEAFIYEDKVYIKCEYESGTGAVNLDNGCMVFPLAGIEMETANIKCLIYR